MPWEQWQSIIWEVRDQQTRKRQQMKRELLCVICPFSPNDVSNVNSEAITLEFIGAHFNGKT